VACPRGEMPVCRERPVAPVEDATTQGQRSEEEKRIRPPDLPHHVPIHVGVADVTPVREKERQIPKLVAFRFRQPLPDPSALDRSNLKPPPPQGSLPEGHSAAAESARVVVQHPALPWDTIREPVNFRRERGEHMRVIPSPARVDTLSNGAPGVTRTPGTQFRKLLLYPPELRGRPDLGSQHPRL
jgi:hypothetical protein